MGSVVVSQVISDLAQRSTPRGMVGGGSHHQDASQDSVVSPATQTVSSTRSPVSSIASSTAPRLSNRRVVSTTDRPSTSTTSTAAKQSSMSPTTQTTSSYQPGGRQLSYHSQNLNQHNRGFDQSGFPLSSDPRGLTNSSPSSPRLQPTYRSTRSLGASEASSPSRIKVRDLSHIQSFASEELLTRPRITHRPGNSFTDANRHYEISSMPVADIIEMVAGLLTKITTTNDQQHEHVHRPIPTAESDSLSPQTSCVLAFHGKNVPSITILSYLSRIHKYCPTTYEVFLSLLVYFDRMTDQVNSGFKSSMKGPERYGDNSEDLSRPSTTASTIRPASSRGSEPRTPPSSGGTKPTDTHIPGGIPPSPSLLEGDLSQFFVVDSYNIHRLIIAGVTCASKFFSDVFYTNSRYAKVCQRAFVVVAFTDNTIGRWIAFSGAEPSRAAISTP